MSSNAYPKITIRKINPTIGSGQSLLSPRMITINPGHRSLLNSSTATSAAAATLNNQQFCYLLPSAGTSILRAVTTAPTTVIATGSNLTQNPALLQQGTNFRNFQPSNTSITFRPIGSGQIFNSNLNRKSMKMHPNDSNISLTTTMQTSLLSPASASDKKIIINKRIKKVPNKFKEESLLATPPAPRNSRTPKAPKAPKIEPTEMTTTTTAKAPKTPRGRKRKQESLLLDPAAENSLLGSDEKKKKGRKPKEPAVPTPGMKKTKARASLKSIEKEKKNRTSLVPVSRISQIMRSVPSLTTLKPEAIAIAVQAAVSFT